MIAQALEQGAYFFIQGGISPQDWRDQRALAAKYPGRLGVAVGLHPEWVSHATPAELEAGVAAFGVETSSSKDITAWGELGLHFSPADPPELRVLQEQVLLRCLRVIRDTGRSEPLVLHGVRAQGRLLELWDEVFPRPLQRSGLVHSFSGSFEAAQEWIKRGLLLSPSPALARAQGHETLKKAVRKIPAEWLVLESDCPDQSPARDYDPTALGSPLDVLQVAEALARLRGESLPEGARRWLDQSLQNLKRVGFSLPAPP